MSDSPHELDQSIDGLAEMIEEARRLAEAGQVVELDVLAMKIAVLSDALAAGGKSAGKQRYIPRLEHLVEALGRLDIALRKRNVNLALDLEQADRRLRAQLAYGGDPAAKDVTPKDAG
jgi:hypothetical protein